jgi:hypothetical protein
METLLSGGSPVTLRLRLNRGILSLIVSLALLPGQPVFADLDKSASDKAYMDYQSSKTFSNLVGKLGSSNPMYSEFIQKMIKEHGLTKLPSLRRIGNQKFQLIDQGMTVSFEVIDAKHGEFMVNHTRVTIDSSKDPRVVYEEIEKALPNNKTAAHRLYQLFFPDANAIPILIPVAIGVVLLAVVIIGTVNAYKASHKTPCQKVEDAHDTCEKLGKEFENLATSGNYMGATAKHQPSVTETENLLKEMDDATKKQEFENCPGNSYLRRCVNDIKTTWEAVKKADKDQTAAGDAAKNIAATGGANMIEEAKQGKAEIERSKKTCPGGNCQPTPPDAAR